MTFESNRAAAPASPEQEAAPGRALEISGLLARAVSTRLRGAVMSGKLREEELDDTLSLNARTLLEAPETRIEWVPVEDFDSLLAVLRTTLGDDTAIVDFAGQIVESWATESTVLSVLDASLDLVDAPGFVTARMSELLVRDAQWQYRGGRAEFVVEISGLSKASVTLQVMLGAVLARLAECPSASVDDVRFDGIEGESLRIFGVAPSEETSSELLTTQADRSRLHRAALIG